MRKKDEKKGWFLESRKDIQRSHSREMRTNLDVSRKRLLWTYHTNYLQSNQIMIFKNLSYFNICIFYLRNYSRRAECQKPKNRSKIPDFSIKISQIRSKILLSFLTNNYSLIFFELQHKINRTFCVTKLNKFR